MKRYLNKIFRGILFVLPFCLGVFGLLYSKELTIMDSFFGGIKLYTLNYEDTPPNVMVEIARWTAPLATASGIITIFNTLKQRVKNTFRYLRKNSVAVYGNEDEKLEILKTLGTHGIDGGEKFTKAHKYILVGSEEENIDFYSRYRDKLVNREVYIKSEATKARSLCVKNLHPFRMEELAARLYWKERFLYPQLVKNNGTLDIVLLGFGILGEEVLICGMQNLIYSQNQKITWHIFGDGEKFTALHTQLDKISDRIIFYSQPWYEETDILENADLVTVLCQDEQSDFLESLLSVLKRQQIDVFSYNADAVMLLNEDNRLIGFDWKKETLSPEYILDENLLTRAKKINMRYAHLYMDIEETAENAESEWLKLNTFTMYSNISAADYHDVRVNILKYRGITPEQALKDEKELGLLASLEHIRWCRYHYLNNWSYGVPENGKSKDALQRIHTDLIPFEELSQSDKKKDIENIRVMFSI